MTITLGDYTFPERGVAFSEERGDVAGRDVRKIRLTGLFSGLASMDAVETALDEVLAASAVDGDATVLSVRAGRQLVVRRTGFWRETNPEALAGSFRLDLEAMGPYEAAISATVIPWTVTEAIPSEDVVSLGTVWSYPQVSFTPTVTVHSPSVSDGVRTMEFQSTLNIGEVLLFDGIAGKVFVDGVDVTVNSAGEFPRISPGLTNIRIDKAVFSSLAGSSTITYSDRWW